jgi:hypothetical protein
MDKIQSHFPKTLALLLPARALDPELLALRPAVEPHTWDATLKRWTLWAVSPPPPNGPVLVFPSGTLAVGLRRKCGMPAAH